MNKLYYDEVFTGIPEIKAARFDVPEWYGRMPRMINETTPAVRACMPFMDTFITGYHIPLIADVNVSVVDGLPRYTWKNSNLQIVSVRHADTMVGFPRGEEFYDDYPIWGIHHVIRIPKGYSMLVTHPLNRFDLPFVTLSGLVDDFDMHNGRLPFLLKRGFVGTIPQGTPIAQILFVKQEAWKAEKLPGLYEKTLVNVNKLSLVFSGWYKNHIWKKKSYD